MKTTTQKIALHTGHDMLTRAACSGTGLVIENAGSNGLRVECPRCHRIVRTVSMTPTATVAQVHAPLVEGPVSEDFARQVLGEQFANGGGWARVNGKDVYLCQGAHKDGTSGWAIKQIGRSF